MRRLASAAAAVALGLAACSGDRTPLVDRINAFRSAPQTCGGKRMQASGPLAPSSALGMVQLESAASSLESALQAVGYSAARSQAIVLKGPSNASAAMGVLRDRYCEVLLSAEFSEIGVAREGKTWRLVLAQPLIAADLGGWAYAGQQVLELVNRARATPRTCGTERFPAAAPLEWNAKLAAAALAHSRDMATRGYFAHAGQDGSLVENRAERAGYAWSRIGENIATGQGSVEQAVASWLASPVHCANVMQSAFTQMGAAYAVNASAATVIYWTQVFGAPADR